MRGLRRTVVGSISKCLDRAHTVPFASENGAVLVRTCRCKTGKPLGFGDPPVLSEGDEFSSTGLRGHLDSV